MAHNNFTHNLLSRFIHEQDLYFLDNSRVLNLFAMFSDCFLLSAFSTLVSKIHKLMWLSVEAQPKSNSCARCKGRQNAVVIIGGLLGAVLSSINVV